MANTVRPSPGKSISDEPSSADDLLFEEVAGETQAGWFGRYKPQFYFRAIDESEPDDTPPGYYHSTNFLQPFSPNVGEEVSNSIALLTSNLRSNIDSVPPTAEGEPAAVGRWTGSLFDDRSRELLLTLADLDVSENLELDFFAFARESQNDMITESVSLNFAQVKYEYRTQETSEPAPSVVLEDLSALFAAEGIDAELRVIADGTPNEHLKITFKDFLISNPAMSGSGDVANLMGTSMSNTFDDMIA